MDIAVAPLVALAGPYVAFGLLAVVVAMAARLPAPFLAAIRQSGADRFLVEAISFGINSVEGAATGKSLSVDVANPVAAFAVRYALSHAQPWLVAALGTPEELAEKVWARLNLDASASIPDFGKIVRDAKTIA